MSVHTLLLSLFFSVLSFININAVAVGSEQFTCVNSNLKLASLLGCPGTQIEVSIHERISALEDAPNTIPIGTIIISAFNRCPDSTIKANGQSTNDYQDLQALVGPTVPDLRGEFIRGFDDGRGVDSGRIFRSNQEDELKNHYHEIKTYGQTGSYSSTNFSAAGQVNLLEIYHENSNSTGGSETRPRNIALLYCIVTGG